MLSIPIRRAWSVPKTATIAGGIACLGLFYNLLTVFAPFPDLRITTAQCLTLGAAACASAFLASRPATRRLSLQTAVLIGLAFILAGTWQAGRAGTGIPTLLLDLAAAAGVLAMHRPLMRATAPAAAA